LLTVVFAEIAGFPSAAAAHRPLCSLADYVGFGRSTGEMP